MSLYIVTKDPITKQCQRTLVQVEEREPLQMNVIKKEKIKMFTDKKLTCVECRKDFDWTVGEQKFMHKLYEKGSIQSVVEPKRCPDCRQKKKARYDD
jgi:hypothetical protein